jgi:hypothetical protein
MLDVGRAPEHRGGLILFFDHADENIRYVTSEAPRIVDRPEPRFSLVLFRGAGDDDRTTGGLLQLEAFLAATNEQLKAARNELAALGRVPALATPDWRAGSVEVAGWFTEDAMKPLSLALGRPSLVGDPVVVLAARLDRQGAGLAASSLRGDSLPIVLMWKLETLGLAGPLGIEVEADLQAMHERLSMEGALNVPIGRARIAKTWETFAKEQLIRTRIVDESGDFESNRTEALRRVGEDLIARMFSPFPPPELPPQLTDERIAPIELSFKLIHRKEELEQTRRWSFRERRAIPIVHYAASSLNGLLHGRKASDHIFFTDVGAERRDVVVRVEPELEKLAIAAVEVDLDWPDSGELNRTLVMTPVSTEHRFTINRPLGESIRYRVRARFDPAKTRTRDRETDWMEASGDLVVISARRLFPPRTVTLAVGRAEMDWMDHVQVEVSTALEKARSFTLTNNRRSVVADFPGAGDGPLRFSARWRGLPNEPERSSPPFESSDELVILDSPFGDSIGILAVPLPLQGVVTITLDLRIGGNGFGDEKHLAWNEDDRTAQQVGLRRLHDSPRRYQYRVDLIHEDGTFEEQPWVETEQRSIVIGAHKPVQVYWTEIVVLGGGPAGRDSLAIELVLESGANRIRELLEGEIDTARLVLVAEQNDPPPILTAREFLKSGQVIETHWAELERLHVLGLSSSAQH